MPSISRAQQRYFGMLYNKAKQEDMSGLSHRDKRMIKALGIKTLKEFAMTKHNNIPEKVAEYYFIKGYTNGIEEMRKEAAFAVTKGNPIGILGKTLGSARKAGKYVPKRAPLSNGLSVTGSGSLMPVPAAAADANKMVKKVMGPWPEVPKAAPGSVKMDDVTRVASKPKASNSKSTYKPRKAHIKGTKSPEKVVEEMSEEQVKSLWPTRLRWLAGGGAAVGLGSMMLTPRPDPTVPQTYYGQA